MSYLRLFVFVYVQWCLTHIVLCFSSSCVAYVASFSRLSIFVCPSVFSNVYVLTKHNQEHATYNGFWNGNKQCSKFTKTTKYYHNYSTDLYYNSTSYLKIDVVCQTICINNNILETLSMQGVLDTTLCDKICQ